MHFPPNAELGRHVVTSLREHGFARYERRWVCNPHRYRAAKRAVHRAVRRSRREHVTAQLEAEVLPCE